MNQPQIKDGDKQANRQLIDSGTSPEEAQHSENEAKLCSEKKNESSRRACVEATSFRLWFVQ
jgi:hypothetical protein